MLATHNFCVRVISLSIFLGSLHSIISPFGPEEQCCWLPGSRRREQRPVLPVEDVHEGAGRGRRVPAHQTLVDRLLHVASLYLQRVLVRAAQLVRPVSVNHILFINVPGFCQTLGISL